MRRLVPICFGVFILASLAIFFFGDSGLSEYQATLRYERSLAANVEALKQRNQELASRLQMLKSDRETVIALARDVGLYETGDNVVKLVGRPPQNEIYAVGDLLRRRKAVLERNSTFKEAAIGAVVVMMLAMFFSSRVGGRKPDGARRR
jgi:cell division protein FtsB